MKADPINERSVKLSVGKCNLEGTSRKCKNGVHNLLVPCIVLAKYHIINLLLFSVSDSATYVACTPGGV